MAQPNVNQAYESFYSYKLDGKEVKSNTNSYPIFSTQPR